ncbi:hypothetical protein QVA66_08870 [Staphylococcus chromogenes]|nr:hypothetical protein [Staphylococcus chromogenes]
MKAMTMSTAQVAGQQNNAHCPYPHTVTTAADLEAVERLDHVVAEYVGGRRSAGSFVTSNCLVMNVDNSHTENQGASVFASGSGKGIYQALWDSRNPDAAVQAYELDGQNLKKQGPESKIPLSTLPDNEHQQITWVPSDDRSGVQALRTPLASTKYPQGNMGNAPAGMGLPQANVAPSGTCGSAGGFGVDADGSTTSCEFAKSVAEAVSSSQAKTGSFTVQASSPITGQSYTMNCSESSGTTVCRGGNNAIVTLRTAGSANSQKLTAGSVVLEGTVVLKHPSELMNGQPTPNGEPESNEYILLWFDTPREVTGQKSGTPKGTTRTNKTYGVSLGKKE